MEFLDCSLWGRGERNNSLVGWLLEMTFRLFQLLTLFTAIRREDPELWERIQAFARKWLNTSHETR
jgi:hypothetical protein